MTTKKTSFNATWTRWVVCDEEGNVSYDAVAFAPEQFSTFRKAEARAAELALRAPGSTIYIYEASAYVRAPVGAAETSRKHPREHYSVALK